MLLEGYQGMYPYAMLCSVRKCKFCSSVQPWLMPILRSIGMMQVAMCYRLLAGYLQMSQKRMIHMAAALACTADHGSAVRRQMIWFIPCSAAVAVTALLAGLP